MTGLVIDRTSRRARRRRRSRGLTGLVLVLDAVALTVAALTVVLAARAGGAWDLAWTTIVLGAFTTVGGLIVSRQPGNPIGWIYSLVGLAGGVSVFADAYTQYGIEHGPYPLAGTMVMAWLAFSLPPLAFVPLVTFGFLLFPDGRLPSRRWRSMAWFAGAATVVLFLNFAIAPVPLYGVFPTVMNPLGASFIPLPLMRVAGDVSFFVFLACALGSVGAMIVRLRNASGELRLQLEWMTYGACLFGVTFVSGGLLSYFADVDIGRLGILTIVALPVTASVAIFKYRLYDIDIVISKTIVYGSLAVFITASYVAIVVGIGTAIGAQGKQSLVISILGAALVAAVFQPVRQRVERSARRLVYGERATPYDVLARFSERMAAIHPAEESTAGNGAAARRRHWIRPGRSVAPVRGTSTPGCYLAARRFRVGSGRSSGIRAT